MTTETARNAPCPCGSKKKFKRCCGFKPAPAEPTPTPAAQAPVMPPGMPAGFDPSQLDPALIQQVQDSFKRLPKGQLIRMQSLMQKAMAGKDVTREAQALEAMLPPKLKSMFSQMQPPQMQEPVAEEPEAMDEDAARKVVEAALKEGKISKEEADKVLQKDVVESPEQTQPAVESEKKKKKGFLGLFRKSSE